jgi:CBS domain containing-hemolysin-like protein
MYVYENYDRAISAILIGNNVVNIAASSLATIVFTFFFASGGAAISTVVMTILVLIFGEVLPKSIAKNNAEKIALAVAPILVLLMRILTPLTAIFSWMINRVNHLISRDAQEQPSVTEDELKIILEEIEDEGVLNEHESELMQSALDFTQITVEEVLTPRVDVVAAEEQDSIETIRNLFLDEGYSRIPVYRKDMDHILGVINSKDFFRAYLNEPDELLIEDLLQPTIYVPPKKLVAPLMKEMQRQKMHMAIVTDQYGGTIGIVTLEDMIEEIIGEVWDENDEVEMEYTKLDEQHYLISGDMNISDFFELFGLEEPEELDVNTVGGWVQSNLDRMPQTGDHFTYETLSVRVDQIANKRVEQISVEWTPPEEEE